MGDGTVLVTNKLGFSITKLLFGEESAKHIANEIQSGIRPADWNQAGAAGFNAWRETLKLRNTLAFDPTKPTFGYAKVILPQGPGIGAYTPQAAAGATPIFAPATGAAAVEAAVTAAAGNPAVVGAALFQPTAVPTPAFAPPTAPTSAFVPVAAPVAQPGFAAPAGV